MRIFRFEEGNDLQEYTLEQKLPADYQNGSTLKAFTLNLFRWHQVAMSDDLEALEEYAREYDIAKEQSAREERNEKTHTG